MVRGRLPLRVRSRGDGEPRFGRTYVSLALLSKRPAQGGDVDPEGARGILTPRTTPPPGHPGATPPRPGDGAPPRGRFNALHTSFPPAFSGSGTLAPHGPLPSGGPRRPPNGARRGPPVGASKAPRGPGSGSVGGSREDGPGRRRPGPRRGGMTSEPAACHTRTRSRHRQAPSTDPPAPGATGAGGDHRRRTVQCKGRLRVRACLVVRPSPPPRTARPPAPPESGRTDGGWGGIGTDDGAVHSRPPFPRLPGAGGAPRPRPRKAPGGGAPPALPRRTAGETDGEGGRVQGAHPSGTLALEWECLQAQWKVGGCNLRGRFRSLKTTERHTSKGTN